MSLATMLPLTMQVLAADKVRRYGGNTDYDWNEAGQEFACDLQPIDSSKRTNLLVNGLDASHNLFWDPADVLIDGEVRIKVGSDVFQLVNRKQSSVQRAGWPAKAMVVEARP